MPPVINRRSRLPARQKGMTLMNTLFGSAAIIAAAALLAGAATPSLAYTAPAGTLMAPHSGYQPPPGTLAPRAPLVAPAPAPAPRPALLPPPAPAPLPPPPPKYIIVAPTPNGFIAGGASGGHGAVVEHQDQGGGYQTNSGMWVGRNGTNAGVSVTTDPNGRPVGGAVTGGTTFK